MLKNYKELFVYNLYPILLNQWWEKSFLSTFNIDKDLLSYIFAKN